MDEILGTAKIDENRSLHIATLSRETVLESGADHLGFNGYFLFEANDSPEAKGINILAKICSLEAAFQIMEIWKTLEIRRYGAI